VKAYLDYRLENIEQGLNLLVTVGFRHKTIIITFYPILHYTPEVITRGDLEYIVHLEDSDEEWEAEQAEQAFMAISQTEKRMLLERKIRQ
jgi:hypothetical protein